MKLGANIMTVACALVFLLALPSFGCTSKAGLPPGNVFDKMLACGVVAFWAVRASILSSCSSVAWSHPSGLGTWGRSTIAGARCAYPSLMAQLAVDAPARTAVCVLVDKEEIGSVGASGMESLFFENAIAEIMELAGEGGLLKLRRALAASRMLSSDVSAGLDPAYANVFEPKNAAFLGRGLVFNKYTGARGKSGSNDASAEYVARVRKVMDDAGVNFQTAELGKVDAGGGGTIAFIPARYNMDVIDSGVAVLSMHAPWEVISKADLYEARRGYEAFLRNA